MNATEWQKIKEIFHATVDLPETEAAAILEKCDVVVRREVEKLHAANCRAENFIAEPAAVEIGLAGESETDFYVGKRIDSYEILNEIGHGGMGTVYLAARAGDFAKQVALKLIKRGMDTNAVLKRFVMERQILANLDHPNIARLLDGGSTADGLPYLVMEYIDGVPVTKFCDLNQYSIEERLELFCKICKAISFAHQNLVVHRDIKPSNILVTNDGEPKLLDFGIAKLLHPDWSLETDEATATMFRVMTPEYASPEQIRGLPITTASDVYSLGIVLYELLSGERPYKIESRLPDEVAKIVLTEEPLKPSAVVAGASQSRLPTTIRETDVNEQTPTRENQNPKSKIQNPKSLKGDLDNIILKALRKEPERRYQSAQEFSADIRRHLDGLPVTATADSVSYRVGKFVKRHRFGAAAGAAIFLILLLATAVTSWQAVVARRERDKAEHRFGQVRKLAATVLFDYHDGIEKLAGSTPMREKMVKDALEYLDNLSAESGSDADLQRELAAAYQKVADVQGAPYRANLGNYKGALESYKKALAIRENLNSGAAENAQFKLDLMQSYSAVGELSQVTGNVPEALENYRKAFAVAETFGGENADLKRTLAVLHRHHAKSLALSGKLAEAMENFKKSIAVSNELLAADPSDAVSKRDLGFAHVFYGDALVTAGDLNGALAAERAAYALLESLILPNDAQSRREANVAYARIARVLSRLGDKKGALEIEMKALAIDEELVKADPSNVLARRDVFIDYFKVAQAQSALGDFDAAIANFRKAIALCEAEIALNPLSAELSGDLVANLFFLGETLEQAKQPREALESYKRVMTIQQTLADEDPTNALQRGNLSEILSKVSDMNLKFGDRAEALEGYRKSLAIREELVKTNPENADGKMQLAYIYKGLGEYYTATAETEKRADDWREAKRRFQQSLDIWTDLQQKAPLEADAEKEPEELKQKIQKCEANLK